MKKKTFWQKTLRGISDFMEFAFPRKVDVPVVIDTDSKYQESAAWPDEWYKGFIKTQNGLGIMVTDLGHAEEQFVEYAKTATRPLMDIGCAYGVATRPAIAAGGRVIAVDLSKEHLDILKKSLPEHLHKNLRIANRSFPNELTIKPESIDGILAASLFHFLNPQDFRKGLKQCYKWLVPGGKLWITMASPYFPSYQPFLEIYDQRVANGDPWPGVFTPKKYAKGHDEWLELLPDEMQIFKKEELVKLAEKSGFDIIECDYFAYPYFKRWVKEYTEKEFLMMCVQKPDTSGS